MLLDYADESRDRLVEHAHQMVHINSVEREVRDGVPFDPGVKEALDLALSINRDMSLEIVGLDGHIEYTFYGRGGDYVCTMGRVDVVSAGEGWKEPSFKGHMESGVIYGRGIPNNEGPVMAYLCGLVTIRALGFPPRHLMCTVFGYDEETGFEDPRYYLSEEEPPVYRLMPDCKYPVVHSKRGETVVRITGIKECPGIFFDFVNKYFIGAGNTGDRLGVDYYHEEHGMMEMRGYKLGSDPVWKAGQGNVRRVNAGNKNTKTSAGNGNVADAVHFEATLSYPGSITIRGIMKPITGRVESYGPKIELIQSYDPMVFAKDTPMAEAMQDGYERATGMNGTLVTTTGGTYTKAMPGIIPLGLSSPGQRGVGHNPNE